MATFRVFRAENVPYHKNNLLGTIFYALRALIVALKQFRGNLVAFWFCRSEKITKPEAKAQKN